jgi:hypothetical protein
VVSGTSIRFAGATTTTFFPVKNAVAYQRGAVRA